MPPMQPSDFAQEAGETDQYEIMAATVALHQSRDPQVLAFAREMIDAHTRTSQALMQAAARSGLPPPKGVGADRARMLMSLQSLSGPQFDKQYVTQQVVAHQGALVVQQGYAADGGDANLRQAAAAAVLIIQRHLQMAQQLKAAAGG